MEARSFYKMSAPIMRRLANMMARGIVALADSAKKMQQIQCRLLAGEVADLEHFEPYGWTSRPHPGAEVVTNFLDGDRSHGVVIIAADRRYRMTALEYGEVAVHDDLGQSIHLTRTGIVVKGGGLPMLFTDTPKIRFETPKFEVAGNDYIKFDMPKFHVEGNDYVKFDVPKLESNNSVHAHIGAPDFAVTGGGTGSGTASFDVGTFGVTSGGVRIDTPLFEVTGDIEDTCDTNNTNVREMRIIYDDHHHPENGIPGPTEHPNELMGGH